MSLEGNQKADSDEVVAIRQSIKSLNVQREALELESAAIEAELMARNPEHLNVAPMGIDTPLTDADGYPRGDIDVFRARTLRNRLAVLRTDHKNYMQQIEVLLKQLAVLQQDSLNETAEQEARRAKKPKPKFDPVSGKWVVRNWDGTIAGSGSSSHDATRSFDGIGKEVPITSNVSMDVTSDDATNSIMENPLQTVPPSSIPAVQWTSSPVVPNIRRPFSRVESVASGSPAEASGLQAQDEIVNFGPISEFDNESIAQLVQEAAHREKEIKLEILRGVGKSQVTLQLSPRTWSGRGLLGCHIVPVGP